MCLNANETHSHLDFGARTMGAWARRLARILHAMLQCVMLIYVALHQLHVMLHRIICISYYEMMYHNVICV